jgi:transposase
LAQEPKNKPQKGQRKDTPKTPGIKKKFKKQIKSIKNRKTIVLFQDECHLKHGDAEGYVWGKKGERISVPMMNERHSQTFYGALDLVSREFHLKEYDWANMANTVDYLQWLMDKYPLAKRIIIVWDGASFHTGELVRQFLQKVNGGLKESKWKLHCLLFAPNAPEQNPVEDCWLQAKNYVRRHILETTTFKDVVKCFNRAFNELNFDFGKLGWYF